MNTLYYGDNLPVLRRYINNPAALNMAAARVNGISENPVLPPGQVNVTFKKAPRIRENVGETLPLPLEREDEA